MNETDFEELDRAVNSLNTQPQATVPAVQPAAAVPVSPTVGTVVEPQPATAPVTPIAPRPASGRFMDVVHPSADMRGTVVPRPAVELQPVAQPSPTPQPYDIPTPEVASSPFLPDAQVEKRPLGAFATPVPSASFETTQPATTIPDSPAGSSYQSMPLNQEPTQTQLDTQEAAEDALLPPELHNDLLDIESNEDTAPQEAPQDAMSPQPETAGETAIAPAPAMSDPVATFGDSIPQQYTEKPTEQPADAQVAPVFDAHAFSQPPKKKNGWMVVLWITLLILLGAGAGAAIYFYVLPLL